ncbi:MAG: SBBP repeat-containing protein, partial [candidate division Zixibacteria bacterium]|nr:SBBP repeat-containing protein [candidate division Zixibacteria bacterium]
MTIGVVVLVCQLLAAPLLNAGDKIDQASVMQSILSMPLAFTQNDGQWPDSILYRANAGGVTMWFTATGAYYEFIRQINSSEGENPDPIGQTPRGLHNGPDSLEIMMLKASFVGANLFPQALGGNLMEYKCNYFFGNDPSQWRTDVPNYESIILKGVYPGIDLTYYGNGHQMEYDFVVRPGADYSQIQIEYEGAEGLALADDGALVVKTKWGEIRELAPVVYQEVGGSRQPVTAEYVIQSDHTFGFCLGSEFNSSLAVVIDPVLVYSTYLGGSGNDEGGDIAVDASGAIYVMGSTGSTNFPMIWKGSGYDHNYNGSYSDVFVTKLPPSGDTLIYSTYLGGNSDDWGYGIAIDGSGAAYLTGWTASLNFPTHNAYQATHQGDNYDAFVTKLSSDGDMLVYSTYLGGSGIDNRGLDIAVDAFGSAYVTGTTYSTDFPAFSAYQGTNQGSGDAFVTKFSSSGSNLVYSTYLGGSANDEGNGIAVNGSGSAYVTGFTESSNFPTVNYYQGIYQGNTDVFVTKLTVAGDSLIYSTYLGGDSSDIGYGIAVDASGSAYVTGYTKSTDFPTLNPVQGTLRDSSDLDTLRYLDVFVTKVTPTGNNLGYSTYLGGYSQD